MPLMRRSPCSGTQRVALIASSASCRSVRPCFAVPLNNAIGWSMAMNHCGVLRKITGFFERHECGILMLEPSARDQHTGVDQGLDHRLVGIALLAFVGEHALAGKARRLFGEAAVGVDGVGNSRVDAARREFDRVGSPNIEILAAMAGRGVDEAGAGIFGDVIAGE